LNAKINEEREINVNLPLDYFDKEFAGKNILFKGFVKEIKEKRLPPLDNEFAKLFKCDSLEKLKEEARIIIEEDKKRKYKEDAKMKIVKELLKSAKFEIPSSLVKKEYEYLLKVYKNKENDEALYEYAKERVKLHLLLYEIAKVENLIAENEEVEKVIKSIISQPNIDKEKKKVLLSQRGRENIKYDLTLEKTLEFLFNKACIIEK
jgi:trigger factor